jgi:alpha-galactosidase
LDRLTLQQGFTYAYTPHTMMSWVNDVPDFNGRRVPLQFRFLMAMQGSLGIGADLNRWQPEDLAVAKRMIGYYKSIRDTAQNGLLYRLTLPGAGNFSASEYVSENKSQAVLFAFLHSQQFGRGLPAVLLKGLDGTATYALSPLDAKPKGKSSVLPAKLSGAYLMEHGLPLLLEGDYDSTAIKFDRISP